MSLELKKRKMNKNIFGWVVVILLCVTLLGGMVYFSYVLINKVDDKPVPDTELVDKEHSKANVTSDKSKDDRPETEEEIKKTTVSKGRNDCLLMGLDGNVKSVTIKLGHDTYADEMFTAHFDREGFATSAESTGCSLEIERGVRNGYKFVQFNITEIEYDHTVYMQFGCKQSETRPDFFSVISDSEGLPDVHTYKYDSKGAVIGIEREFYDFGGQYTDLHTGDELEDHFVKLNYKLTGYSEDNCGNWVGREYKNNRGEYLYEQREIKYYE